MAHNELREWTADEINEYDDARRQLAEDGQIDKWAAASPHPLGCG